MRRWPQPRLPEHARALFLETHGAPAPRLLAGTSDASLYEFVPGALLDKHASLFNGRGLGAGFFAGYGQPPAEPNTTLHRVMQTMRWATGPEWASWEQDLPTDLRLRTRDWLKVLLSYIEQLPRHIERLRSLL